MKKVIKVKIMNEFDKLKKFVLDIDSSGDIIKFYERGNKTAGVRIRKKMQEMKELAQNVRNEISDINNNK
jgi:hypothetical protein